MQRASFSLRSASMPAPNPDGLSEALRVRTRALNGIPVVGEGRRYVLCWLQQALRGTDNPVADVAVRVGNALGLPVVVYHGMREDYPYASRRLHSFLLGASRELQRQCEARGLRSVNLVVRPSKLEKGLVYRLAEDAALVVTDDQPLFVGRWQADRFAAKTSTATWAVEAGRVVPKSVLKPGIKTTRGFRAAAKAERDGPWSMPADVEPEVAMYDGPLPFVSDDLGHASDAEIDSLIAECRIDQTLPPGPLIKATGEALDDHLRHLVDIVLPVYKWRRNNPAEAGSASYLSPYLHFGMVGPRTVYTLVRESDAPAACKWKYLDELLTWREWFHYLAQERESPADYRNVPVWARETLDAHRGDPREKLYSSGELLHAETDDEVWNACQRQFLLDGYMHNNLRMYWGKQILRWTRSPEEAWSTACYLNDRLSYDGRDPATYGNIEWVFGRARPGYRELPVYGKVAPKSPNAILGRAGMKGWLEAMRGRDTLRANVPNRLPDYADPGSALGPGFPI